VVIEKQGVFILINNFNNLNFFIGRFMKKLFLALLVFSALIYFNGCGEEEMVNNNPVTSTTGVFVLYEGAFNQTTSYDYGFIDMSNDTVYSSVYSNSNGGQNLNSFPNGMLLDGNELFIAAQGTFGQPGSVYKINATSNQLISSQPSIGTNPYSLKILGMQRIYITNTGSNYVKLVDRNFNPIVDSIPVGFNPADIVFAGNYLFVAKQSYAPEKSLALILNEVSNPVTKIFFGGVPVSVAVNSDKVYVSTYSYKKLFALDAFTGQIVDSIDMPIAELGTGYLASGSSGTMYVLGTDTAFQYNLGKSIYKVDLITKAIDPSFTINFTGTDDIYGFDYDDVENSLYVANSKGGTVNGEVRVYNPSGTLLKTYADIGGKYPRRFAFKRQ
jgi:YVTN family beta-propeller protein